MDQLSHIEYLKTCRQKARLSCRAVSLRLGMDASYLWRAEQGLIGFDLALCKKLALVIPDFEPHRFMDLYPSPALEPTG